MQLTWFDLTAVRAHATQLVEDLHRHKAGGTARGDKMTQTGKRIDKLLEESGRFEQAQKLNFYQKAKLLSLVREGLASKNWEPADIEAVHNQLLTSRLRRPASSPDSSK